jgi:hypothetical protein
MASMDAIVKLEERILQIAAEMQQTRGVERSALSNKAKKKLVSCLSFYVSIILKFLQATIVKIQRENPIEVRLSPTLVALIEAVQSNVNEDFLVIWNGLKLGMWLFLFIRQYLQ